MGRLDRAAHAVDLAREPVALVRQGLVAEGVAEAEGDLRAEELHHVLAERDRPARRVEHDDGLRGLALDLEPRFRADP